jgi:hypothetical protein
MGNGLSFLLPEDTAAYTQYITDLTALGQIPWWSGLMGTLQ